MLEVIHLDKWFGEVHAVHDVSFRVASGESVGLLGPNGAGKSTTVSMISGLIEPDDGQVLFKCRAIRGDCDPRKRKMGLVPQELALVEELSGLENLSFFGKLQGLKPRRLRQVIGESLTLLKLSDRAKDPVKTYSGGMKRRLNLAVALLHDPEILLLDEPTVGVDPQSRNTICEGLELLKSRGKSLVYTTQYMEEAERLCDRIVIIDQGRVVMDGNFDQLAQLASHRSKHHLTVEIAEPEDKVPLEVLKSRTGVSTISWVNGKLVFDLISIEQAPDVLTTLATMGYSVTHFTGGRADLASIFLSLTGRSLINA